MAHRGIDPVEIERQVALFRRGVKPAKLSRPARTGDGIVQVPREERSTLISLHDQASGKGRMVKFVPASGAATRMFEGWHRCYRQGRFDRTGESVKFLHDLSRFAFYDDLKQAMSLNGEDIEESLRNEGCANILEYILTPKGLDYASLPKALLKFHIHPGHNRTAMEEHLAEAAFYVRDHRKICRIHFTVSEEHESRCADLLSRVKGCYERLYGVSYDVGVTTQLPSTDTIAVDMENRPFKDRNGNRVFRPGGHGALLRNLNGIEGDLIFLKNIDNVVPDPLKDGTVLFKKVLGGFLVRLQDEIFRSLGLLSREGVDDGTLSRILSFCRERLSWSFPDEFRNWPVSAQKIYVLQRLNRPVRVCGMVKNEGEPGGGPFWVEEGDGTQTLQIIEQNQIDTNSEEQKDIWRASTHFNPVDLVCGVRDYRGKKFDLELYADREAVSISKKSHEGCEIKALELPGLWNGSMAFWNTVFVEVPIETFHPVKTIDDLLRRAHLTS